MTAPRTFRRLHLTIVVHSGKKPREITIAVPIPGDIVTDAEIRAGRVSVYSTGMEAARVLPPGYTLESDAVMVPK